MKMLMQWGQCMLDMLRSLSNTMHEMRSMQSWDDAAVQITMPEVHARGHAKFLLSRMPLDQQFLCCKVYAYRGLLRSWHSEQHHYVHILLLLALLRMLFI